MAATCDYSVSRLKNLFRNANTFNRETRGFKERDKDSEVDVASGNNMLFERRGATRRWGKGNNAGGRLKLKVVGKHLQTGEGRSKSGREIRRARRHRYGGWRGGGAEEIRFHFPR